MHPWRTAIAQTDETSIRLCGYDVTSLMRHSSFPATVFLLHRGRLPTSDEARLLDAVLIAVADHGSGAPSCAASRLVASGNRQSFSAAVAAGILAIGDEHGGAGEACMMLIGRVVERARRGGGIADAARAAVGDVRAAGGRVPGLGHRQHTKDPRVDVLFSMAEQMKVAGDGIAAVRAIEAAATETIKPLPMNIDGALAGVLFDLGFPPSAGKLIFMVGRVAGLTAEVAEEHAREKPMRIRIPVEYDGVPPRPFEVD
jgi:citrate synthase